MTNKNTKKHTVFMLNTREGTSCITKMLVPLEKLKVNEAAQNSKFLMHSKMEIT